MARIFEPTKAQEKSFKKWVASRPAIVRVVAERFEPWSLYRLKTTGQRVQVISFGEGHDDVVTLTVRVSAEFNATLFERDVFGINPDDLEPCELPGPDEPVGALLAPEEVDANLDALRAMAGIAVKH